jgi:hypothetical protein
VAGGGREKSPESLQKTFRDSKLNSKSWQKKKKKAIREIKFGLFEKME